MRPSDIDITKPNKFDFGCGVNKEPGYIGVDGRSYPGVDIITDILKTPDFPENCASVISSCHLIEHFTIKEQRELMKLWKAMLVPGGKLIIHFPDVEKVNPTLDMEWAIKYIYGHLKSELKIHKSFNTAESITELLLSFGYCHIACNDYIGKLHFSRTLDPAEKRVWTTTTIGTNLKI